MHIYNMIPVYRTNIDVNYSQKRSFYNQFLKFHVFPGYKLIICESQVNQEERRVHYIVVYTIYWPYIWGPLILLGLSILIEYSGWY